MLARHVHIRGRTKTQLLSLCCWYVSAYFWRQWLKLLPKMPIRGIWNRARHAITGQLHPLPARSIPNWNWNDPKNQLFVLRHRHISDREWNVGPNRLHCMWCWNVSNWNRNDVICKLFIVFGGNIPTTSSSHLVFFVSIWQV